MRGQSLHLCIVSRFAVILLLALLVGALSAAPGRAADEAESLSNPERLEALQASVDRLEKEAAELRVQAVRISEEARQAQARLRERLSELRDSVDLLDGEIARLRELGDPFRSQVGASSVESREPAIASGKQPAGDDAAGWPWWIDLFLVLVLCVALYLAFRRLVAPESERMGEDDTGFVEENELGAIRYPGSMAPASPSESPREERAEAASEGPSPTASDEPAER